MRHISKTFEYEIGDAVFEIEVISYSPVTDGNWDNPPEGGEVEVSDVVKFTDTLSDTEGVTTYRDFVKLYADNGDMDIKEAERNLDDELYDKVREDLIAEYESSQENWRDE